MNKELEIIRRVPTEPPTREEVEEWLKVPPKFLIDVSRRCNLACPHCPYSELSSQGSWRGGNDLAFIDAAQVAKLYEETIKTWGNKTSFEISADGETLMHPQWETLICTPAIAGVDVGITNNGTLLTPDKVEKMCRAGVKLINISLDAGNETDYGEVRKSATGANHFRLVTSNIARGVEIRNKTGGQTRFMITMILNPHITGEKEMEFIGLGKLLGVDVIAFRPLNSVAGMVEVPNLKVTRNGEGVATNVNGYDRYPCRFPFQRLSVTISGPGKVQLAYCPHDFERGLSNLGVYPDPLGRTLKEIWETDPDLLGVRKAHLENNFRNHPFCGQCPDWRLVTGRDVATYEDILKIR